MLYGRFDFAYDGRNIKMLEYNADTPTGLLEASVAQWLWIEQVSGIANRDQFNSIHEDLIKRWKTILPRGSHVHFAACQGSWKGRLGKSRVLDGYRLSSSSTSFRAFYGKHRLERARFC